MKSLLLTLFIAVPLIAHSQETKKPNVLIIWGDDVGMWDLSAYHRGMMGSETPNIDRIAKEGMLFMDHYAHASCTAGRAALITGQYPIRTGLSTVGLPGAPQGLQKEDPFERFTEARGYDEWAENRSWLFGPAGQQVGIFVKSFEDYPPRQPSFSPNVGDIAEILNRFSKSRR